MGQVRSGIHLGKRLQTPQYHGEIDSRVSWHRTTLIKQQGRWQMVELCEALHGLTEQEEMIEEAKGENVLMMTILTKESFATEEMGFEVDTGMSWLFSQWSGEMRSCLLKKAERWRRLMMSL